ncbi:unnamed protein product [Didymodactylos carnosus]|uniref:Uncharacterized protein n=1 Tax=Didymodactylos carnosus TaxID=1234261 RepID=A0A8S2FUZ3_9BILA|nr:unnamed protein product [Didymodactylos carnosus]CAF4357397.1 unnamed protein product [Didymodactylos carnosus]
MDKPQTMNADQTAPEELAAQPVQLPTHPSEIADLPPPNIVPDGVSPPVRHPLDPLTAGKQFTLRMWNNHECISLQMRSI